MNGLLNLFISVILIPSGAFADGGVPSKDTFEVIRTVQVDKMIIGVTSNFEVIAFDCNHHSSFQKTPVAVFENTDQVITFKESTYDGIRLGAVRPNLSIAHRLTEQAAQAICVSEKKQNIILKLNQSQFDLADTAD